MLLWNILILSGLIDLLSFTGNVAIRLKFFELAFGHGIFIGGWNIAKHCGLLIGSSVSGFVKSVLSSTWRGFLV